MHVKNRSRRKLLSFVWTTCTPGERISKSVTVQYLFEIIFCSLEHRHGYSHQGWRAREQYMHPRKIGKRNIFIIKKLRTVFGYIVLNWKTSQNKYFIINACINFTNTLNIFEIYSHINGYRIAYLGLILLAKISMQVIL